MKQTEITYPTPEYPRQLRLDTSTFCQAKCLSCHRLLSDRKGRMPIGLIGKILDDVARWPVPLSEIIPVNYGEFFTLKEWPLILKMISSKLPSTQITIPTNGAALTEQGVTFLCEIPTVKLINFSINAYFDETYEAFMGLPASNIGHIIKTVARIKLQRPDIRVWVSMVFDPSYQTDIERDYFESMWEGLADMVWVISASSACRSDKKVVIPTKIPCRSIFSDIVVGYDGKLNSCCWDASFSLSLGVYTGDLKKDWKNPKLNALRQAHNEHQRDEYALCRECTSA